MGQKCRSTTLYKIGKIIMLFFLKKNPKNFSVNILPLNKIVVPLHSLSEKIRERV